MSAWATNVLVDGDFTEAVAVSLPDFSSPSPANTDPEMFTQDYMIALAYFEATPLNTPHPSEGEDLDYSEYFLVNEGQRKDMGGGIVKWTRTYAKVPDGYDDFESYGYHFIGFTGQMLLTTVNGANPVVVTGRLRETHVVSSRVRHDYFKVGPGAGYARAGDILIVRAQEYLAGGLAVLPTDYLQDAVGLFPASNPSRTTYNSWVAAANSLGWGAPVGAGQILAEDSRISRWKGNVWCRQLRYVLAQ